MGAADAGWLGAALGRGRGVEKRGIVGGQRLAALGRHRVQHEGGELAHAACRGVRALKALVVS